jgi:hypothetical protein
MKLVNNRNKYFFATVLTILIMNVIAHGQAVPGKDENIPFLMTFGKEGQISWGDDDFSQSFFFTIPKDFKDPFYIRVFDPDIGGENDEIAGDWNTKMQYSVYGGNDCIMDNDETSKGIQPIGNYKSGTLLATKTFGFDPVYDNKYYTFGPFNPSEGKYVSKWNSYVFKIVCDGISGDDGNNYRYFLSREQNNDREIEGANAFTYEYSFRMWNDTVNIAHIYPYIDTGTVFVQVRNFDWDADGNIIVRSTVRKGQELKISNEADWAEDRIKIDAEEIGLSLDFQFIKRKDYLVRNNNVVMSVENQYGENLQFFSAPIGGVPVYQPKMVVRQTKKK